MRQFAMAMVLALTGCATRPSDEALAQVSHYCGEEGGDAQDAWTRLPAPPQHAQAFRRRAEPYLWRDWSRWNQFWFARANGDVKLCVFDLRNPCVGGVWEFRRGEAGIEEIEGAERICIM